MRRSLERFYASLWPARRTAAWRKVRRRAIESRRVALEALETRLVLTGPGADPLDGIPLDAGQLTALAQGIEIVAHQLSAVQVTGVLGASTAGLRDPLGILVPVGPTLGDRLAAPLAERLAGVVDVAGVRAAIAASAALDDDAGDAFAIPGVSIRESGNVLWFELTVRWQRDLPRYQIDLDQHPAANGAAPTLFDRGLRIGAVESTVRVGFDGVLAFGIDRTQGTIGLQAIQARMEPIRLSARVAGVAEDVKAVLGAFRLGADDVGADIRLDIDVAATLGLAAGGSAVPVARLVSGVATDHFVVAAAADSHFDVSIPWRLGIGGFVESGGDVAIRVGTADPFAGPGSLRPPPHPVTPLPLPGQPPVVAAGGATVDLVDTLGRTRGLDFGAAVAAGARMVPGFLADQPVALVGRTLGEVFDLRGGVERVVAPLSGAGGAPTYATFDDLAAVLGKDLVPRWDASTGAIEITFPMTLIDTVTTAFAPDALLPRELAGRVDAASGSRLGGLALVGDAKAKVDLAGAFAIRIAVGLPPGTGDGPIGERVFLPAGSMGTVTVSLDASFRGGAALGPVSFTVGEGLGRIVGGARIDVAAADLGPADGRSTLAEIATAARGGAATTAIVASSLDGIVALDAGDAAGVLGLDHARGTLPVFGAGVGAVVGRPKPESLPAKPVTFVSVAGTATWNGVDAAANDRLAALSAGLSELSLADVPAIVRLVADWVDSSGLGGVALPLVAGSLGSMIGIGFAADAAEPLDLLPGFGDPAAELPRGTAFTLPSLAVGAWGSPELDALAGRGTYGLLDLDLGAFFDVAIREVRATVPAEPLAPHAAALDAVQRLVWDFNSLRRDWEARSAGPEGFADFDGDFVRRLRAWGAALGEISSLLPAPVAHPDFDWSLANLPHYAAVREALVGIAGGIESLRLGIEDLVTAVGAALPGIPVSFAVPQGGDGRSFDLVLGLDGRRVELLTAPTTVEGIPLAIAPDPNMRLALGGTITARIGLDGAAGRPALVAGESSFAVTAKIDLGGSRSAGATLGGLSGLTLGSQQTPISLLLTDSSGKGANPARFTLAPGGTLEANARFTAALPLFHPDRVHLGSLKASGVAPTSPGSEFPLTVSYTPEIDPATKRPWFATVRAILEAPDLPVNLGAWTSGAAGFLDTFASGLEADLLRELPLLGGVDVASIGFFARLDGLFDGIDVASPATLRAGLAALSGATATARIVSATGQDRSAAVDAWDKLGGDDRVIVDLSVAANDVTRIPAGDFRFGLDALGLEVRGAGTIVLATDLSLAIGLGYSRVDGFFVEAGEGVEIHAGIGLGFDSAAGSPPLELRLGSLYFDLQDGTPGAIGWDPGAAPEVIAAARAAREFDAAIDVDLPAARTGLAGLSRLLPAATVTGSAKAGLDLAIGADILGASRVTAHVRAGWSEADGSAVQFVGGRLDDLDLDGKFHFDGIQDVRLGLDGLLGENSVVSRLLEKFEAILDPLDPIVGVLRKEVPIVSELSKRAGEGAITYLDAIREMGTVPPSTQAFLDLVDRIDTWTSVVGAIARGVTFDLGDLGLGAAVDAASLLGGTPVDAGSFSLLGANLPEIAGLESLREDFGIAFPLLDRPEEQAFDLLFGRDVDLVTWDLPDLDVGFGVDEYFTIFGPLVGHLFGSVSFVTDFGLGFDTRGIRAALGGSSPRPSKVFDGLYFDDHVSAGGVDAPEAKFVAEIGGGIGVGLPGFAVAGIDGGFTGFLGADLHDNNRDGKVHLDEFVDNFLRSPECVFDLSGALEASLEAYLEVGFDGPWGWVSIYHRTYEIASATLADFDSISCPPARPVLAEVITVDATRQIEGIDLSFGKGTKVLVLNAGPRAGKVVPGATTDGDEEWVVSPREGGGLVVSAWGHSQEFDEEQLRGVTRIVFDAGAGADTVEAAVGVSLPLEGFGGPGNDRLTGSTGANRLWGDGGRVEGEAGDDVIKGRSGPDRLFGGPGDDFIWGYGGGDTINGGDGDDFLYGEDESGDMAAFILANPAWGAGTPGADTIDAGSGFDNVLGGEGDDALVGGEGDDFIAGGAGADRIQGGAGDDQLLGDDGDDTIHGDGADPLDPSVAGDDLVEGGAGANVIHGGPGDDTLWAASEAAGLFAPGGSASISLSGTRDAAGGFVSWVSGDDGRDTIHGTAGRDFLSGGFDSDVVRGGTGDDEMLGGPGSDLLVAAGGAARIFGGHGDDVIDAGAGDNHVEGGPGDDDIYAREGSDTVYGGVTAVGDAYALADEASGRQIVDAIHGGFASRLRTGAAAAPCEPEVFYHPEVYPDAPGSIVVTIFEDLDADGVQDPDEGPANAAGDFGIVLGNRSDRSSPAITASSAGGDVRLPERGGLVEGDYLLSLRRIPDGGWTPSPGTLTSVGLSIDAANPTFSFVMGFYRPGRLAGSVAEVGSGPAAGVPVYLDLDGGDDYDVGEPVALTDARGEYSFENLLPGTYSVRIVALPTCATTSPAEHEVTLVSGGASAGLDFRFTANDFPVVKRVLLGEGPAQALLRWTPVPDGPEQLAALAPVAAFGRIAFEVCAGVPLGAMAAGATLHAVNADGTAGAAIQLAWIGTPVLPNRLEYAIVKPFGQATLPAGRYRVTLDDASVKTAAGGLLDGEWTNPTAAMPLGDRFASGDGTAGGDFAFDFVVGPAGGANAAAAAATVLEGTVWHDLGTGASRDPDLAPGLAGRAVEVLDPAGRVVARTISGPIDLDGDGRIEGSERGAWRVVGLPEGRYLVRLVDDGDWATSAAVVGGGSPGLWSLGTSKADGTAILSSVDASVPSAARTLAFAGIAVRDVAITGDGVAWVTGTSLDAARGLPAGKAGLWRLDTADGALVSYGAVPGGSPIVALDAVDEGTLLGIRADGTLVRFLTAPRLWSDLGPLVDAAGAKWFPVGDLAVVGPREVYATAIAGAAVDPAKASPGGQALVRIDPVMVGINTAVVRRLANDKIGTLIVGLERIAGATLLALGLDETLFEIPLAPAARVVARGRVAGLADLVSGGLAAGSRSAVPVDPEGPGAWVDLRGGWTIDVDFGSAAGGRVRDDGADFIDGGCGPERDVIHGDNGGDLPDDVISVGGDDWLRGRQGDDEIRGGQGGDTIIGNDGADLLVGGSGGFNWIEGGMAGDRIQGGAGTDFVLGGSGADAIDGGDGADVLLGGADADAIDGGAGNDVIAGGTGADEIRGGLGDDTIVVIDQSLGGEFDLLPPGAWKDRLDGGAGIDTVLVVADVSARLTDAALEVWVPALPGGQRQDLGVHVVQGMERGTFTGGAAANTFDAAGFSGPVTLVGGGGNDVLAGGAAADWLVGNAGDDTIDGGGGGDTILPGTGSNRLSGGVGDDVYQVIAGGVNTIVEAGGADTVDATRIGASQTVRVGDGFSGTTISGAAGTQTSFANAAVESVRLGSGSDTVVLRDGAASVAAIDAGGGTNTLSYADPTGAWKAWIGRVVVDLLTGAATGLRSIAGFGVVRGGAGDDTISGGALDDDLDGGAGNDRLDGRGGNDRLEGGPGNDVLRGGAGDDTLSGSAGTNNLDGEGGDDTYVFGDSDKRDTVTDALGGANDRMLFDTASGILFAFGADGRLVATWGASTVTVPVAAGIERIRGGRGTDVFRLAANARFGGVLDGGGSPAGPRESFDTLDYSAWNAIVTVDLSRPAVAVFPATGTGGVSGIRHVVGGTVGDRLTGGAEGVWFEGRAGGDTLVGSAADDLLDGGNGNDTLRGLGGHDVLRGGWGSDTLVGGTGDDEYGFADLFGSDTVAENPDEGFDRMDFAAVTLPVEVTLGGVTAVSGASRAVHDGSSIEQVVGGSADDRFVIPSPNVSFPGILDGGEGPDTLVYRQATAAIDRAVRTGASPNVGVAVGFSNVVVEFAMAPVVRDGVDLDGNGTADTIWRLANGQFQGWLTNAAGNVVARRVLGGDATWSLATVGDFDGDGTTDLAWRHAATGAVSVSLMRPNGAVASSRIVGGDASWAIEAGGDFDGDGKDDLVWRHAASGVNSMWLMDGTAVRSQKAIGGDVATRLVATGPGYDADGDGRTDLVWRLATGINVLRLMSGPDILSTHVLAIDATSTIVATGDFNGDRRHDLAIRRADASVEVRLMDGASVLVAAAIGGDSRTDVVGTVDRVRDGRTDLVWRDAAGSITAWEMNGTAVVRRVALGGNAQTTWWRRPGWRPA